MSALVSKPHDTGNGDTCPLFPEHGNMSVLRTSHDAPHQWCAHQVHDGQPGKTGVPRSRALWPLYGFEESVAAYLARLHKAVRTATLPDLNDLEVL